MTPSKTCANAAAPAATGPIIEVAAGLVFRGGRLLITQRRSHDHLGGLWEFPGGKREFGESYEDCVVRELQEELGIKVRPGRVFEEITHAYPEKTVHLKFLLCRWIENEPVALGCAAFAWVTAEDLSRYAFPAADAQLLERLITNPDPWRAPGV